MNQDVLLPTPQPPSAAFFRLPAEPESAGFARRLVRPWLAELDCCDSSVVDDALLVLTELVANAVEHTSSRHLTCRVATSGGTLRLAVEDEGGTLAVPRPRMACDDAEGGRGLMLVEALSAAWGVGALEPEGRVVWAVLKVVEAP